MQVPAVKRARDLVCGSIGTLPIDMFTPDRQPARRDLQQLLDQPEPDVPASVTWTRLLEDLFFEGRGWFRVLQVGAHSFPVKVRRLDPRSVNVGPDSRVYVSHGGQHQGSADEWVPDDQLIRFDSPNDGLLVAGARAIRTALTLDAAAARYADDPVPLGWFEAVDGVDPFEDEDTGDTDGEAVGEFLTRWSEARQKRAWGYVPAGLALKSGSMSPRDLQLNDARQHAVLEIARAAGVDPEDLGVSTTSRTYFNAETKRKDKLDFTLLGYITAVDDRLSMPDVTPRGYYVRHNLDAFLRSDTLTRYQSYEIGQRVGAVTREEVRELEDRPPIEVDEQEEPQMPNNVRELPARPAAMSADEQGPTFDAPPALELDAPPAPHAFSVDIERRTITGLAVPYGKTARHQGSLYSFSRGTIRFGDPSRVKLLLNHDRERAVGHAVKLEDTDAGLMATFKVARGDRGDEALIMAEDRVWDGLSAGFTAAARFVERDGVFHAADAPLFEISLTPVPAYDDARVHAVAAMADTEGNITMTESTVKPANATEQTTTTSSIENQVEAALKKFGVEPGQQFAAADVTKAIADGFAALQRPQVTGQEAGPLPERETVAAGGDGAAQFQIKEELPYRFDGATYGEHHFLEDLRDGVIGGNHESRERLAKFMEDAHEYMFAVTTGNVAALNPSKQRPELYVPSLEYARPLWDSVSTGVIADQTPFIVPKFSTASGLVADHVQGTEPTPGAFAATSQTVSPGALSGKVEVNREVIDQGGSPQADTIIWREMQMAYYEAIEAKIAALLNALSAATLYSGAEINLGGAVDDALQEALLDLFADLQFARGGNRYSRFVADGQLFPAMVKATDTAGRALFPVLGPSNAQGQTDGNFSAVQVGSQPFRAAWALGAAVSSHSYGFVPSSVWAWASAPKRFTFEYQVKSVDIAVWGYAATAVLRTTDVIRLDYTTADA